jgi:hypothetical protein
MPDVTNPADDAKKAVKTSDHTVTPEKKTGETTLSLNALSVGQTLEQRQQTLVAMRPSGSVADNFSIDYPSITKSVNDAGLAPGGEVAPKATDVKTATGPFVVSQVADGKVIAQPTDVQALTAPTTLKPGDANFIPAGWIQYPPGPAPEVANAPITDTAVIAGPPKLIDQGTDAQNQHLVQTLNADGSYVTRDTNQQPPRVLAEKDSAGRESKFVYTNGKLSEVDNATGTWKQGSDGTWANEKGDKFNGSISVNDSNGSFNYQDRSTGITTTWNLDGSHQVQFKDGTKFDGTAFDATGKATTVKSLK